MAENILLIILIIPLYGSIIWSYFYPEESLLFGKRWMYKEEPELSNAVIRYTKFTSMIGMIGLPIVIIGFIFDIFILKFSLAGFILVVVIGAFKIFTDEKDY
ncbi:MULTISPECIES: hypothetical protein [unclassified Lysinibacillus]|uniref:hypothetical protein n=1 Tax=unclassified Lysinibacillus TaxID=2636778 RepID=UPI002011F9C3|nr:MULTISPECIES: hypothetical protein [unclassified Lysinibacillus]MCL1696234.1 hypothetical protein [Lysinibacillus sp. BPa_S21]MCL1700391.1 hypothetical protein [Lysinibacillus sp. Bpr_S20]